MRCHENRFRLFGTAMTAFLAILVLLTGCTSKPKSNSSEDVSKKQPPAANTPSDNHFDGGAYCVRTLIQAAPPAQSLHFSIHVVESDPALKSKYFEADLAGDTLDVVHRDRWLATDNDRKFFAEIQRFDDPKIIVRTIQNGVAEETVTNHYNRSDESGWRIASTSLAMGGTPWNLFVSKPTVSRVGTENVSGYDTIKYAVDTTHDSQTDKAALLMAESLKDYNITGTAWVLKDANCVLQYNIDFEQDGKDGKVSKTHYEGSVTKK
jgi:hypothetical protein